MKKLFLTLVLAAFAAISFAQNVPSYVPTNGLVGWWPFNGNANDESGNGNNGTVNGATLTTDRFGNVGKAYSFDGVNDYIEINTMNISSFTFLGWHFVQSMPAQYTPLGCDWNYSFISNFHHDLSPNTIEKGFEIRYQNPGNLAFSIGDGSTFNSSGITTQFGSWKFFGLSYDSINQEITLYNGITDTIKLSLGFSNINLPTFFGARPVCDANPSNSGFFMNGKLDDIGIWNRVLTQQEITDLYNGNICYQNITVTDTLLINTGITGFNPITYENTLRVWPNPTNDHITIDAGNLNVMNGYSIRITNSLGQQMFQSAINQQQFYLDLSTWTGNGMYFLNLIDPSGNIIDIKKIVLQ
jgi:hypothetical protein